MKTTGKRCAKEFALEAARQRREVLQLRAEREVPNEAAAFFAKDAQ
jgi:hypothetical protein